MTPIRPSLALLLFLSACRDDRAASSPGGTSGPDTDGESTSDDPTTGGGEDESTSDAPATTGETSGATETGDSDPTGVSAGEESSTGADEPPWEVTWCPAQAAESAYCLTFEGFSERVLIVGADTGQQCPAFVTPVDLRPSSIAWIDDTVIVCNANTDHVVRIDLDEGEIEDSMLPCSAVTELDGALFVAPSYDDYNFVYRIYDSFDDIVDGDAGIPVGVWPMASVFAGRDATLFAAYFSTEHLELWDIANVSQLPDLVLENHDGFVQGLSVTDTSVFVSSEGTLREFDRITGDHIDDVVIADPWADGLACRSGM